MCVQSVYNGRRYKDEVVLNGHFFGDIFFLLGSKSTVLNIFRAVIPVITIRQHLFADASKLHCAFTLLRVD